MAEPSSRGQVVIVGGGVAALETLMALRDLAPDAVSVTLVAAEPDFVFRPMSVAEPFGLGEAQRYPLRRVVDDFGGSLVQAGVASVDAAARRIVLRSGDTIGYDTLVLAPGARMLPAFDAAVTFGGPQSAAAMRALLDELEAGSAWRFAFVVPTLVGWALPLYELALLTARHAAQKRLERQLVLVTPEPRPLALFGDRASATVAEMLAAAGVEFVGESQVEPVERAVRLLPSGRMVPTDRLVALPLLRGPRLDGVYAAGDATNFPIKQGGLATQQADAVAEHGAAHYGARLDPAPFRPVLRGMLFAGGADRYLRTDAAAAQPLWWPPTKIAGRYLAPYVYEREPAAEPGPAPEGFVDLEVPLEATDSAPVRG